MSTNPWPSQPCDMPDGCGAPAGQVCEPGCPSLANDQAHDPEAGDVPGHERSEATAQVHEVGEVLLVDPRELVTGANVRHDIELDPAFVADIATRGVRQLIQVRRGDGGRLVVRLGQRRTLAAVRAGVARVRVFVEPDADPAEHDRRGQADRVIDQLAENEHRAGMSERDKLRAHQQLLDLGLTVGQIARRRKIPRRVVQAAHAVSESELARQAMDRYELTIDQAAAIAEFDSGSEEDLQTVKALTVAAKSDPQRFAHVLQRGRDDRAERERRQARERELTEAGVRVLAEEAVRAGGGFELDSLRPRLDDEPGTTLREDEHRSCPGHALYVRQLRPWEQSDDGDPLVVVAVCTDPQANGHGRRWTTSGDLSVHGPRSAEPRSGPMSDEEKQERRRVIANNKAWDSATMVRRQWLTALVARKSPPNGAQRFLASILAGGSHDVRRAMESHHCTACELLGVPGPRPGQPSPLLGLVAGASAAKATQISLAVVLGALEDGTSRDTWRNPTAANRIYLEQLREWGYGLSEVELTALGERPVEAVNQALTADRGDWAGGEEGETDAPAS